MKKVLFLLFCLISISSFAQNANGFATFEPIITSNSNENTYNQINRNNAQVGSRWATVKPITQSNSSSKWQIVKAWHSDGTFAYVRYKEYDIQIFYNEEWCNTELKYDDEYSRYYVKTPANKRYYIQI